MRLPEDAQILDVDLREFFISQKNEEAASIISKKARYKPEIF